MGHALKIASTIVSTVAISFLDAIAIVAFLIAGIVCVAVVERRIAHALSSEPAQSSADLPELLHRLTRSLECYARDLLAQDTGRFLPWLASIISVASGVIAFAALSFGPAIRLADLNTGILFIFGASFLAIHGGLVARGFSAGSNSLAGLGRSAMRVASFEAAAALALISGVVVAGSISVQQVVEAQLDQGAWFFFLAPVGFLLYLASSIAGIDSAARPSTRAASEREAMATDASEMFRWPFGSLGATLHLLISAGLAVTVFWGGWLRPFASFHDHFAGTPVELLDALPPMVMAAIAVYCHRCATSQPHAARKQLMRVSSGISAGLFLVFAGVLFAPAAAIAAVHGAFWFLAKMGAYIYGFLWLRARIPQFRFGRPIRAAWNFLIPLAAINLAGVAAALVAREHWDWSPALSTLAITILVLGIAVWLGLHDASQTTTYGVEA
jgi:NADH-quinone oxidoreductase subunit H